MEPYLVSEVLDSRGNTVLKQEPTVVRRTISEETSAVMCRLLASVVEEGTAKNASVAGYSIGGKTGTSEKIDVLDENGAPTLDKIVSFVGIAPMDDPEYIVLVALDTPSRATGIYISGGVMAAPTVGAVMADILPYLGVSQSFPEGDAAGQTVTVPDLVGATRTEGEKQLKELGITASFSGDGDTVTGQIPAAGETVPGGSQILLYLGEKPPETKAEVPDFLGMNRIQAEEAAAAAGIYILIRGNDSVSSDVKVMAQSAKAGALVAMGTTVYLNLADLTAAD